MYLLHRLCLKNRDKVKSASRSAILVLLCVFYLTLSACGGSGSSGFDIQANAEQSAISKVDEEGGCVNVEGILICAPESNLPSATEITDFPVSDDNARLSIDPVSGATISCTQSLNLEECKLMVRVMPSQFEIGTQFFMTTHFTNEAFWSKPLALTEVSPSELRAEIALKTASITGATNFQIAVLVYGENTVFPENQGETPLLSNFSSSLLYVVAKLKVTLISSP